MLQNPCFSISFKSILHLAGGAVCDRDHRWLLGCVCFKTYAFYQFYKHFGSHWGCCLRPRSSLVAGVRLLQNLGFSICFTSILALTGGAVCDCVHARKSPCPPSIPSAVVGYFARIIFKLLLRPWDLSHRAERQRLMVNTQEEISVRVQKGSSLINLLLH